MWLFDGFVGVASGGFCVVFRLKQVHSKTGGLALPTGLGQRCWQSLSKGRWPLFVREVWTMFCETESKKHVD